MEKLRLELLLRNSRSSLTLALISCGFEETSAPPKPVKVSMPIIRVNPQPFKISIELLLKSDILMGPLSKGNW
jgi:hypothetical protein